MKTNVLNNINEKQYHSGGRITYPMLFQEIKELKAMLKNDDISVTYRIKAVHLLKLLERDIQKIKPTN